MRIPISRKIIESDPEMASCSQKEISLSLSLWAGGIHNKTCVSLSPSLSQFLLDKVLSSLSLSVCLFIFLSLFLSFNVPGFILDHALSRGIGSSCWSLHNSGGREQQFTQPWSRRISSNPSPVKSARRHEEDFSDRGK